MIKAEVKPTLENKIIENIAKKYLEKVSLEVGFFESATYSDGTSVAEVAFKNNFGWTTTPPRPFFTNAIAKNKNKWKSFLFKDLKATGDIDLSFERLGVLASTDIQKSIMDLKEPPNSPSTIKKKKSSNPLVDARVMHRNVTYNLGSK